MAGGEILYKKGVSLKLPHIEIKQEEETPLNKEFVESNKPYEQMEINELQDAILAKMAKNGPINDQMLRSVRENVYRDSLLNWVKSFN